MAGHMSENSCPLHRAGGDSIGRTIVAITVFA